MPTNPMLSAGHMGIVDALKYGVTRDYATISAALAAIGGANAILLIPFSGDGVWTVNTALTFPTNVMLFIAPGVSISHTATITINGQFVNVGAGFAGPGTLVQNYSNTHIGRIITSSIGINSPTQPTPVHFVGFGVSGMQVRIEESFPGSAAQVQFYSNGVSRGILGLSGNQDISLTLQNSARFQVNGGNMGLAVANPTFLLHLATNSAGKPGGGSWSDSASDARVKTVLGPYTDGLPLILGIAEKSVRYVFNGKAGTSVDNVEYIGLLAQDLQPLAPYMVGSYRAKLDPTDAEETDILYINTSAMSYALCNAVKALEARLAALETP